tara:strand:- start:296 stop:712 length:417 start_codon:yes stop_codon:yes gene_type:complete
MKKTNKQFKNLRCAFRSFYDKLKQKSTDKKGRIIGRGSSGYLNCYPSGPVDKGPTLRIGLPEDLKMFAGSKYGASKDGIPNGLSYQFETVEECADFFALMLEDFQTFVDTIIKGDGTRYFTTWANVTVNYNAPYKKAA